MKIKKLAHLYINLGEYAATKMANLNITPNQLSWLSQISILISGFLFCFNNYFYSILGMLFLQLTLLLNIADGALARVKNMPSFYGKWANDVFDEVRYPIVITGIAIGSLDPAIAILACIGIVCYMYDKIVLFYGKAFLPENPAKIMHVFTDIFGKLLNYSIVILALLNAVRFFVLIFTPFALVQSLMTFYIYDAAIKKAGKAKKNTFYIYDTTIKKAGRSERETRETFR